MDGTKGTSVSPCQESLANQKLNCLKDIMDTLLQLSDEEWKALTKDMPKMHTRLEFAALCTKIVTSVSASIVKSYLPSLIDIFGMESVLQADANLRNSEDGSGCRSTTSTSSGSSSARTTAERSPANVAAVIGDIVGNTLNDLKNAMQTAIWKVASVKASSRSTKLRTETCPLEKEKKMLSGKPKQPTHTENTEKGGKIYVLNEPVKEIDPDTAAITGKIVMVVLDMIEGSSVEQTDLEQTRGLLTAAAERLKLLASRSNLYESIIQSTSEQIAPVTHKELQSRAARSVSKVLLNNVSVCTLSDSTELPTASMPCQLCSTATEIVGTVIQNIQDTLSASGQSSHSDEQQTSDDFLISGMSTDSGVFSATNRMFHTIHEKVKEFFNVSKKPVKHSDVEENSNADRISQLDDLTMNCTNDICGEIISLYNSDFSESKGQTPDGGETSEALLTSHHDIHSVMKGLEQLVTMSRSSLKSSLAYSTGQRSKDLLIPESVSVGKEFSPDYPLSAQYAGRIFSDRFQEKAIQTIADVLLKTEEKIFASASIQYSTAPSPVTSEPDMPLSNAILGTSSGSSTELLGSLGTAELLTDSIACHIDSTSTDIVENIVQDLDMISTLEEVDMSEIPSTSSAAHVSRASGIMGAFLKQLRRLSSTVRSDDSGSLSETAPPQDSFLSAARKIHRKIHEMVFGFFSEREELVLADSFSVHHDSMSESRSSPPFLQDAQPAGDEAVGIFPVGESPTLHVDADNYSNEVIGKVIDLLLHADQLPKSSSSELSKVTQVVSDILVRMASSEILTKGENDSDLTTGPTDFTPISENMLCAAADVSGTVINVLHDFYESMHSKVTDASSNADAFVGVFDAFSGSIVETNSTAPLGIFSKVRCHLRDFFMAFNLEKRPSLDMHLLDNQFMPGCSKTDSASVSTMESSSLTSHVSGLQMMEDDKIVSTPKKMASTSQSTKEVQCEWQENHMNLDLCTDEVIAKIVDLSKSELTNQYTLKDFHILTSDSFQANLSRSVSNILFKMVESCPLSSNHQIATDSEVRPRKEFSELSNRVDSAASEISRCAGSTLKSFLDTVSASENESGLCMRRSTSSASVTPLRSDDVNLFTPLKLFIEVRDKLKGIFTPLLKKSDESNWISSVHDRDAQVSDERALTQPLSQRLDSAMTQLENLISEDTIREHARGITDLTAEILRKDKTRSGGVDGSLSDSNLEMSGRRICASSSAFFPSTIVHLFAEESIKYLLLHLLNPRTKLSLVARPSQAASCTFSNQDMQGSRDNEVLSSCDGLTSEASGQIEDPVASHVEDGDATSSPPSVSSTPSIRTGSAEVHLGNPTLSSEENMPRSTSTRFRFVMKKKSPIIKFGWKFLKKSFLACRTSVSSGQIKDPVVSDVTPEHVGTQRDCGATSSRPSVSPPPSNSAASAEVNLGNLTLSSEENLPRSSSPCLLNDSCLLDPAHAVVEKKSSRFFSILKKRSSMMKFGWKKSNKVCPEKPKPSNLHADNPELSSCVESVSAVSSVVKPPKMVSRIVSAISRAFPKLSKTVPQ